MDALIGYTGFVGSNLRAAGTFDAFFNSKNIEEIRGQSFGKIVCAGVTAAKWWANLNPDEDLNRIKALIGCLDEVDADRCVLISTVDVYPAPVGVSERDAPDESVLHAYGRNRLFLERYVQSRFRRVNVVRLPGLFGPGLKKNVIFDLMHDNLLDAINPDSSFQWYPVRRLAGDLTTIEAQGISLINIVTEPVATRAIQENFFRDKIIGAKAGKAASYDVRSEHAALLGGRWGYHMNGTQVLGSLRDYLIAARAPV